MRAHTQSTGQKTMLAWEVLLAKTSWNLCLVHFGVFLFVCFLFCLISLGKFCSRSFPLEVVKLASFQDVCLPNVN